MLETFSELNTLALLLAIPVAVVVIMTPAKLLLHLYQGQRASRTLAGVVFSGAMILWYVLIIGILVLLAFKVANWLGIVVLIIMLLWLFSSAIPTLPQDTAHALDLRDQRRERERTRS